MKKEIVFSNSKLPIELNAITTSDIYAQWHSELKIIYVAKGSIYVDTGDSNIKLNKNEFIIVNSFELVSIQPNSADNAVFLEYLIKGTFLDRLYEGFSSIKFKCCSTDKNISAEKYDYIKTTLFQMIDEIYNNKKEKDFLLTKTIIELSLFLINNFKFENIFPKKKISNKERLIKILGFLENNYENEVLTVDDVASHLNLSSHYVLKLFKENFDLGLMNYLNSLRVKKSINDLLYTDKNILEIAIDNGFTNTKSYHRIFKKVFNTSPGVYRKEHLLESQSVSEEENESIQKLLQGLLANNLAYESNLEIDTSTETKIIDLEFDNLTKVKVAPYWKKFISLGKAAEGLKADIQYQIKELKRDIKPEYVKFNGIFNDELYVYNEDSRGKPVYNFSHIDKLLDFLIQNDLKPFFNIGFMPKQLGKEDKYIPMSSTNTSYPKDLKIWLDMVRNFTIHLLKRYGHDEVSTWYFEIWNNPNLQNVYWHESFDKFLLFFKETFYSIKNVAETLKVGGPSAVIGENNKWYFDFFEFLLDNNLKLDFFSFHSYYIKDTNSSGSVNFDPTVVQIDLSDKEAKVKKIYSKLKQDFGHKPEVILSEWNLSPFAHTTFDTCFMSSFIVENSLKNHATFDGIIYWTCTENKIGTRAFYGGLGLFTTNNLKKASYNAFVLLDKLGNECISKGSNHYITQTNDAIQIMLHNNQKNIDPEHQTTNFETPKEIQVNLKKLEPGEYFITKYYLNKNSGSTYDAWLNMGAPKKISPEIFEYLKSKEKMAIKTENIKIDDTLIISEHIDLNGVVFIEINKINIF